MARIKLAPGSHGEITYQDLPDGRVRGTLRFRRLDLDRGQIEQRLQCLELPGPNDCGPDR